MDDSKEREPHAAKASSDDRMAQINKKTGRNMPQAVATGTILIVLIVASLVFNPVAFVFLCAAFIILGVWELRVDFATAGIRIPTVALWIGAVFTLLMTWFYPNHVEGMAIGVLVSVLLAVVFSSFLPRPHHSVNKAAVGKLDEVGLGAPSDILGGQVMHDRMTHVSVSLFAVMYLIVLAGFIVLPLTMGHPVAHGLMVVIVPALGDTGGLFFGAAFGRHKLSPRISPKKSWEGLFGSVLFTLIGTLCIGLGTYSADVWARKWWVLVVMGLLVGVTGLFGDLCASMIKRDLGLKDMGHLLKGHGGVLDRTDSVLISAPFITLILALSGL